jgi:RNA polymerase sigma factor (sigma-70 family)
MDLQWSPCEFMPIVSDVTVSGKNNWGQGASQESGEPAVSIHRQFSEKPEPLAGLMPHNRCMADAGEHDWVEQAKKGDRSAVAELHRRYWRAARAAAYGVTGDLSLAEDAASEAFCLALQGLKDLDDPDRFGPWLRMIVVRSARRIKAAEARHRGGQLQELPDTEALSTVEQMEQRELAALIHQAVGHLPERLREAVSLFYFEGYDLKESAAFLDVPVGTLKRRLHEARRRLREAASAIMEGRRSMDPNQERVLQRLRDVLRQELEPDRDVLFQALREAGRLRPLPRDLFAEFWRRRMQKKKEAHPAHFEQIERELPKVAARWFSPSSRALDASDPVGKVAQAIREALPQFKSWQPDPIKAMQSILRGESSAELPPGFADGVPSWYVRATRGWLVQNDDGSVSTPAEVMKAATTRQDFNTLTHKGSRLSDALHLRWLCVGPMDLHAVEDLLRGLASAVVPGVSVRFTPHEDGCCRAALRMQLGDISIPAAVGGVLESPPGTPDGVGTASAELFLEAWATAQSGEVIELADFALMMEELKALKREDQP